ncbi:MAG: hypothetical protein AB1696_19905 [Planctomycetota bacterium]
MRRKVLCLGMALGMTAAIFSCGGYDTSKDNRDRCQTNMTVMWQKLRAWSSEKGGTPSQLGSLYPHPLGDRTMFRCPSSSDDPTKFEEGAVLQPHQCSYIYYHLGCFTDLDPELAGKLLILFEKKSFHGPGRNVAFADGKVTYVEKAEFDTALAFTEDWIKKNMK